MAFQHESGFNLEFAGSFNFEEPEERFLYPRLTRLRSWLVRVQYSDANVSLSFVPGIFIFSELACDDRDSGVHDSRYITTLLPLPEGKAPDWNTPPVSFDRQDMRPLPDENKQQMDMQSNVEHLGFKSLLDSYINHINEHSSLQLFYNESYEVYAPFGQSFDDFKERCIEYALLEKSERALKLATRFDRVIQQNDASMLHESQSRTDDPEETLEQIEALQLASKRLLNKAISLHVLDVNDTDEASIRWTNYTDTLQEEAEALVSSLDYYQKEFERFANNLIEQFSEVEKEINNKALDIETLVMPLSSCGMRILRIEKVWLPLWNIRYAVDGSYSERSFKAY